MVGHEWLAVENREYVAARAISRDLFAARVVTRGSTVAESCTSGVSYYAFATSLVSCFIHGTRQDSYQCKARARTRTTPNHEFALVNSRNHESPLVSEPTVVLSRVASRAANHYESQLGGTIRTSRVSWNQHVTSKRIHSRIGRGGGLLRRVLRSQCEEAMAVE